MKQIDLNCDLGEIEADVFSGRQESLMQLITSANVACGGHAGTEETMAATIEQARRWGVAVGAHPGYPDRVHFGRIELGMAAPEISDFVFEQVSVLASIAAGQQVRVTHVKPHGALYNRAASDRDVASAIAKGVSRWSRDVMLVGLAGSEMLEVFRQAGFPVVSEAFADRRYTPDGRLESRSSPDAVISSPDEAAAQALQIAKGVVAAHDGSQIRIHADTVCIHGDTSNAVEIAAAIARRLRAEGIQLCAPEHGSSHLNSRIAE